MMSDYDSEAQQIARQRKYAELLQQQAIKPDEVNQVVSGRVVPYSPLQGLAKMLQAYGSVKMQERADEQQKTLADRQRADFSDTAQKYAAALRGTPEQIKTLPQGQEGPPELVSPAVPGSRDAALQVAMESKSPLWQQMGMQQQLKDMEAGKYGNTPHYDQQGRAYVLNEKGETKFLPGINARDKMEMGPAGQVYNPYNVQPGMVFNDPNKPFALGPNGPVANTPYQKYEIGKARAGASNVSVNTAEKPFLTELGKGAAETVNADFSAAKQALQTKQNVQQIREGLKNAFVGPSANARVTLAQIGEVLGVNGKDTTEKLQNTRNVIQGLARQELSAAGQMKGQGQITEAERGILRRAESGDIKDFSVPELKTLLGALEKTADYRISTHNRNLDRLRQDPNTASIVNYYTLPDQQVQAAQSNQPRNITVDY